MKRSAVAILTVASCIGCTGVARIGEIGVHEIYMVQTCDVISPCTTTILSHSTKDGALNKIEGGTGPSVLGQFLGPASVTAAGYFIGEGIEDSGDVTNVTSDSASEGGKAGAVSGSVAKAGAKAGVVGIGIKK